MTAKEWELLGDHLRAHALGGNMPPEASAVLYNLGVVAQRMAREMREAEEAQSAG